MSDTCAAADEVDLPAAVDPNIKPAAVSYKKTCKQRQRPDQQLSYSTTITET